MAELKTKVNDASVTSFVHSIKEEEKRSDAQILLELMTKITKETPKMWGSSIVGFGSYHYKSSSGREGDWFLTGFSPRKQNLTIYFCLGFKEIAPLLSKLGKHKTSVGCLYVKNLNDIDMKVLKKIIKTYYKHNSVKKK